MSNPTLAAIFCGIYLGYNITVGLLLTPFYFHREGRVRSWREFLLVALVPFIGLGLWAHERRHRAGRHKSASLARMVLLRMGLFNLPFVALVGAVASYWIFLFLRTAFFAPPEPSDPSIPDMAEMLAEAIYLPIAAFIGTSIIVGVLVALAALFCVLVLLPLGIALFLRFFESRSGVLHRSAMH